MKDLAYYDPLLQKSPTGAISKGQKVEFKIRVNLQCCPNEVYLMIKEDSDSDYEYVLMKREDDIFFVTQNFEKKGHFWYNFKLIYNDFAKFLSKTYDSYSQVLDDKGEDFLQLVCEREYDCENSLQGGVIYQIMVDRFCKVGNIKARKPLVLREDWGGQIDKNSSDPLVLNREVFGGNLEGVISKLDYLKDLGVSAIYLNPICYSNSNHKYDTADYSEIDPMFGSQETLKKLTHEAAERQIKIIVDGVYNHTGSDSIYFNREKNFDSVGAYNSQNSKYFDWYEFQEWPNKYSSWWGIDTLPSIREDSEEFQTLIAGKNGIIEKFLNAGVFGVRLDVVDEITDEFTKKISDRVREKNKSGVVMGEVWEDASTKISYSRRRKYFVDNELNSVMNYPVKDSLLDFVRTKDAYQLNSTVRMLLNGYPKLVLENLMNLLGSHDTGRIFSELKKLADDDETLAKQYLKVVTAIAFTLPGVPSIFYGDEYGMENNAGSPRGCFEQELACGEIFDWYKTLTQIRRLKVFKNGETRVLCHRGGKFIFERFSDTEQVVVLTNLKEEELDIRLDSEFTSLLSNKKITNFVLKQNQVEILYKNR